MSSTSRESPSPHSFYLRHHDFVPQVQLLYPKRVAEVASAHESFVAVREDVVWLRWDELLLKQKAPLSTARVAAIPVSERGRENIRYSFKEDCAWGEKFSTA